MATRDTAVIKRPLWKVLYRTATTFVQPADSTAWVNTFYPTFTELGYVGRQSIDAAVTKGGAEVLDDGSEFTVGYNITLKLEALQSGVLEISEYEGLQSDRLDLLFYWPDSGRAICYKNMLVHVFDGIKGGETDRFLIEAVKQDQPSLTAIRTKMIISGI